MDGFPVRTNVYVGGFTVLTKICVGFAVHANVYVGFLSILRCMWVSCLF